MRLSHYLIDSEDAMRDSKAVVKMVNELVARPFVMGDGASLH